jgi:hypothetical protein
MCPRISSALSPLEHLSLLIPQYACRRGLGSNLNETTGIEDLTIQRILRHKNVATTRKHHIEVRDPAVDAAMEQPAVKVGSLFDAAIENAKRMNRAVFEADFS